MGRDSETSWVPAIADSRLWPWPSHQWRCQSLATISVLSVIVSGCWVPPSGWLGGWGVAGWLGGAVSRHLRLLMAPSPHTYKHLLDNAMSRYTSVAPTHVR